MIAELGVRGKIALFEKGVKAKEAPKKSKRRAQEEYTNFIAQAGLSFENMMKSMDNLVVK